MKRRTVFWALVLLNIVLVVSLAWKHGFDSRAQAQLRPGAKAELLMVPGKLANSPNGVVYLVDTTNGLLGGFVYDSNRQVLVPVPPINLNRVFSGN